MQRPRRLTWGEQIKTVKDEIGPLERAGWRLTIIAHIAGIITRGLITATQIGIIAYITYMIATIGQAK